MKTIQIVALLVLSLVFVFVFPGCSTLPKPTEKPLTTVSTAAVSAEAQRLSSQVAEIQGKIGEAKTKNELIRLKVELLKTLEDSNQ